MAIGKDRTFGRQLRTLIHLGSISELSDGQLLERFATSQGEAAELAFSALVERHGAMVLRVCRSVLDDPHASDDAFQATFLVLVAKGRTLWVRDSLGPWLHQVAHRTARCARSNATRRHRLERAASLARGELTKRTQPEPTDEVDRVLLEEIDRLPERFKAPVVLCDLEGQTHEAAARALGWPIGTVKSRQARARDRLRDQLTRRGFAPTSSLALLSLPRLGPAISAALIQTTTTLAIRSVATRAIARGSAAWLAQEVLRSMIILRSAKIASLLIALGATGTGASLIAQGPGEASKKPDPKPQAEARPQTKPQPEPEPEPEPKPQPPVDETVFTVQPGKLELTETARGNLEPSHSVDLFSQVEGWTTILMIKPEGTMVSKGEIVCELDSATLRDNLVNQRVSTQQAEAAYKQAMLVREVAEYAVKEYREGTLLADRARLKGKIAGAERAKIDAEARLERARAGRKKLDDLFAATKGPATPSDIVADLSVNDMIESAGRILADQKQILELAEGELNTLEKFTAEKLTRQFQRDVEQARSDELSRQATWNLNQVRERKIEHQIERCTLRSAGEGMVVYANDPGQAGGGGRIVIEEGATVRERQRICKVIDPKDLRVNAKVSEALVDQVKIGSKVTVKIDATPNQTYTGTVLSVAPMCDPTTAPQQKLKVYTTYIVLDKTDPMLNLRPGMSARSTIVVRELDHVLTVPADALIQTAFVDGDGTAKYQLDVKAADGTIERRNVVLGMQGGNMVNGQWDRRWVRVEIKEGLKAGDMVLRRPQTGFQ